MLKSDFFRDVIIMFIYVFIFIRFMRIGEVGYCLCLLVIVFCVMLGFFYE